MPLEIGGKKYFMASVFVIGVGEHRDCKLVLLAENEENKTTVENTEDGSITLMNLKMVRSIRAIDL